MFGAVRSQTSALAKCNPENGMRRVVFTVTCYICAFWHDTSDFIKQALIIHSVIWGVTHFVKLVRTVNRPQCCSPPSHRRIYMTPQALLPISAPKSPLNCPVQIARASTTSARLVAPVYPSCLRYSISDCSTNWAIFFIWKGSSRLHTDTFPECPVSKLR